MRKIFALLVLGIAVSACAASPRPAEVVKAQDFAALAASTDRFEIASSRMALKRSRDPAILQIAHRMITDHTESSRELVEALADNDMPPPPPHMLPHQQQELNDLAETGDFDRNYLSVQEKTHAEAIRLFQTYSEKGDNRTLRSFAENILPIIHEHYGMIEEALGSWAGEDRPHKTDLY